MMHIPLTDNALQMLRAELDRLQAVLESAIVGQQALITELITAVFAAAMSCWKDCPASEKLTWPRRWPAASVCRWRRIPMHAGSDAGGYHRWRSSGARQ